MNKQNVRAIKTEVTNPKTGKVRNLIYEVVYLLRKNDLRFDVDDKRKIGKDIGDGWRSEHDTREVLNDHVDDFITNLKRKNSSYALLFEDDMQIEEHFLNS